MDSLAFALNWNDLIVLEAHIEHKEGNQETKSDRCADYFYQKTVCQIFRNPCCSS